MWGALGPGRGPWGSNRHRPACLRGRSPGFFLARLLAAILSFLDGGAGALVTLAFLPALSWGAAESPLEATRLGLGLGSFFSGSTWLAGVSGCSRA